MSVLAIDFGTSRIKAAYWDEARAEAVVLPLGSGGRLYAPSLFHVNRDGRIRFGDEAEVMLHHDSSGIIGNLKLDLDRPYKNAPNGQRVKSLDLVTLLFQSVIRYAVSRVSAFGGKAPETIVLTRPARWEYDDLYQDALALGGYEGSKIVIREPEAAGLACMEQSTVVLRQRGQVLEQIRQMKEFQSGQVGLSSGERLPEVWFGAESFVFERELFDEVSRRTVVDDAVESIGGYARKVAKAASESGSMVWCVMAGGTRLLAGLEEKIRERIGEVAREWGVTVQMAAVAQADFATVRGAVLRGLPARPVRIEVKAEAGQAQTAASGRRPLRRSCRRTSC